MKVTMIVTVSLILIIMGLIFSIIYPAGGTGFQTIFSAEAGKNIDTSKVILYGHVPQCDIYQLKIGYDKFIYFIKCEGKMPVYLDKE